MIHFIMLLLSPMTYGAPGFHVHGPALLVVPAVLGFVGLFAGSLVWVWLDASKRNKSGLIVLLFILLTGWPASFIWWFWLRPKETGLPRPH